MEEVDEGLKVCVDKFESFIDVHNVRWNSVDDLLNTREADSKWEDNNFR